MRSVLEVRLAMIDKGHVPIPAIGKIPPLEKWQETKGVTRATLEGWSRGCPNASNTGILTRITPTLDLDLLNEAAAIAAESLIRERFAGRGKILTRIGRHPKRAIPFRTEKPFKKLTTNFVASEGAEAEKLEFLCDGQHFIAHGIHPETQKEYSWTGGDLTTVAYQEFVELESVEEAQQLQDAVTEMLVRDFGYVIAEAKSPKKKSISERATVTRNPKRDLAWAHAALDRECQKIASTAAGSRNDALNTGAFNLFQIIWGNPGLLDEEEARRRLFEAADACGLVLDDGVEAAWRTIESAAEGARPHPRVRPPALMELPATTNGGASAGGGFSLGSGPSSASAQSGPGAAAASAPSMQQRRVIHMVEGERHQTVDEAEDALVAAGGFDIYQRDGVMMRPVRDELPARAGRRAEMLWRLTPVQPLYLIEMLGRCAVFQIFDQRRKTWVTKDCPKVVGRTLVAREGSWRLRTLLGVVHTPQLRADGSLLTEPGYDQATKLLFRPDGEHFPDIPDHPSKDDAARALEKVRQSISTFPFTGEADRSVALSLLLTGVCRRTLDFAPLHAITAPTAGTGKSLLVDLIAVLLTGQTAPVISAGGDKDEFEKRLGASFMAGDAVVALDNLNKPLDHELLCQALTQLRLRLRVLGLSKNRTVTMGALITATGNNLVLQGDLPRRSLRCEIDARIERPELRVFPDIQADFRRRRGELVMALLTVLKAYHLAGVKSEKPALGSFVMWSHWVRDALIWLDCADPCETIEVIRESNPEREKHEAVVLAWRDQFGIDTIVTVRDLIDAATSGQFALQQSTTPQRLYDALFAVAGDSRRNGSISAERLGRWLSKVNGKYEQGLRIVRKGVLHGYPQWQLLT